MGAGEGLATRGALAFFVIGAACGLCWLLGPVLDILLLGFGGVLLGVVLRGLGSWVGAHGPVPARWATPLVAVVLAGALVGVVCLAGPRVGDEIDELQRTLPSALSRLRQQLQSHGWGRALVHHLQQLGDVVSGRRVLRHAGGVLAMTLGGLGSFILFLFVGLFVAFEPAPYRHGLLRLMPPSRRERAGQVLDQVAHTLRGWMIGKLISMSAVGLLTWCGLWLLGVPLSLSLALIAAFLTFVPNFGPVISAVPAILLALMQGPDKALEVAALYTAVQAVESYVITPLAQQKTVALPPALILLSQALMGSIAGGVGLLVATPLAAAVLTVARQLLPPEQPHGSG